MREGLHRGAPRGNRDTAQGPKTWEKLGPLRKYMPRKGKSAVEDDLKKSWSWIETEVGAE